MSKKKQRTVGFAFTGSFCTYEKIKEVVRQLVKEDNLITQNRLNVHWRL